MMDVTGDDTAGDAAVLDEMVGDNSGYMHESNGWNEVAEYSGSIPIPHDTGPGVAMADGDRGADILTSYSDC